MNKETKILCLLILVVFVIRVIVLWVGRPEFVGWFNHTYYYYVQTKGLLQNGKLPFADMPLLFTLYAGTSKVLLWFGVEINQSVVFATRIWMSLIPSLLPIPIYLTLKNIFSNKDLPKWTWVLLFAAAFYPLSILHMPEFLQKNALGLLLLAFLVWQSKSTLVKFEIKKLIYLFVLFLLIVLTHFGSVAVSLLFGASVLISLFIHNPTPRNIKLFLGLLIGLLTALFAFYFFDVQRFNRIGHYIDRVHDSSSLGLLFSAYDPDKFTTVFMLLIPLLIFFILLKWFRKSRVLLTYENSVFWLSNIIFIYLLILPIYEPLLMARFANFLGLPILLILTYLINYSVKNSWLKKIILSLVILGTLTIAFGDIGSSFWHNKNKDIVYGDLIKMNDSVNFKQNDLIITRNGVEHISNWFLGTKSSLITSFNANDFNKYNRVFILNPKEGSMRIQNSSNAETQKYNYMLSNIEIPKRATEIYHSEHIGLYKIDTIPEDWMFDKNGNWVAYKK